MLDTLRLWEDARDLRVTPQLAITFIKDRLTLGATTLALVERGGFDEPRVAALLTAAYGSTLPPRALAYLRGAGAKQCEGQSALALAYLALAGLPKLADPLEAAWRLSAADGLMKAGIAPTTIIEALKPRGGAIECAYNPDQPRVPAGSGRESGQWTSGDWADNASGDGPQTQADSSVGNIGEPDRPVPIADPSPNWAQFLNPISPAEAAGGNAPNAQHQAGVDQAISLYQSLGYDIYSDKATAVDIAGFDSPRVYDFVVQDPETGRLIGVEVKTTLGDTVFLNPGQVAKDVALMLEGGATARVSGETISGVSYTTYCGTCKDVDIRGTILYTVLTLAKVPFIRGHIPGQRLP